MTEHDDPSTVVVRYVEAVRDGDAATIRASFAPDVTWDFPGALPISGTWAGRDHVVDDFLGGMAVLLAPGSPIGVELTNVVAAGEQVVAEWTSSATARNGAAYRNPCLGVFVVRDGRIVSVREYADTQHVEHVLFAEHAPPAT